MPKRVEDIIPSSHRTIREVPISLREEEKRTRKKGKEDAEEEENDEIEEAETEEEGEERDMEEETEEQEEKPKSKIKINRVSVMPSRKVEKKRRGMGKGMKVLSVILAVVVVIGIFGYIASVYFARAVFNIKAKEVPVAVSGTLIATPVSINGSLTYDLASLRGFASTTVPATVGGYTESKGKGIVTLYNSFQPKPWKLIAGTRLVNDAGLIYLLSSSVTIPGYTKAADGTFVPGTIVATVVAEKPGERYNVSASGEMQKLHVVAYKNTNKYESVYAKTTSPITGGFAGNKITVNPSLLATTTAQLQAKIIADNMSTLQNSVPDGYIMYDSLETAQFDAPTVINEGTKNATIIVSGTVYGILFKKSELLPKLAGEAIVQSFKGLAYDTPGLDKVSFSISNPKEFSPLKKNTLIVQARGNLKLVGKVPVDELANKFAGMPLTETQSVIRSYAPVINLEKSSGQVVPPWSKIPTDKKRISIIVN